VARPDRSLCRSYIAQPGDHSISYAQTTISTLRSQQAIEETNGDWVMFTLIMGRQGSGKVASIRGKAARMIALLTTLVITSVAVNTLLILADSHIR
jgi:hypothetical protein